MARPVPLLSKSLLMASRQCAKRMYLECHARELAVRDPAVADQRRRDRRAVAALARRRFAGGVEIPLNIDHDEAVRRTTRALADGASTLYDAAFTAGDLGFRADIVQRVREPRAPGSPDRFDVVEVTSATSLSSLHEFDLAIQVHVLESAGLPVRYAYLMHLNRDYVYPGGLYRIKRLLRMSDRTGPARANLDGVRDALRTMRDALAHDDSPAIDIGKQCGSPWPCPFAIHCHAGKDDDVSELPGASPEMLAGLRARGIRRIDTVPADEPGLTALQRRVRDAVVAGRTLVDAGLGDRLASLRYPIHFLDFETTSTAVPTIPGTRPWEVVPFQWSDHVLAPRDGGDGGAVHHHDFLHDADGSDPRPTFLGTLLDRLTTDDGSIVVWSGYEQRCLRALAAAFPEHEEAIDGIVGRIVDLLPVVRDTVYHPAFHGSFSLKKVLPALVPDLGYGDLQIRDGMHATLAFHELVHDGDDPDARQRLRAALLAYCERDTRALVEVHAALVALARTAS